MFTSSWLRPPSKGPRPRPATRLLSFVPQIEILEFRDVPSTLTVTNNLDSGPGSLRYAIGHSRDGDAIVFDSGLNGQTIALTSGALVVKNSVDIEGPGAGL